MFHVALCGLKGENVALVDALNGRGAADSMTAPFRTVEVDRIGGDVLVGRMAGGADAVGVLLSAVRSRRWIGALVVVAGLVFLLSRLLTRHIMKPIDALDMAEPLENDIYGEMVPLLQRIDDQQTQLKKQNKELAEAESKGDAAAVTELLEQKKQVLTHIKNNFL